MSIALRRFLHNHGNIATEGSPKTRLCPTVISNDFKGFYSAQYHWQHCKLHAFEQFGALYMHRHDDKYSSRLEFETGTPRLQAPVDTNEPSGSAYHAYDILTVICVKIVWKISSNFGQYHTRHFLIHTSIISFNCLC